MMNLKSIENGEVGWDLGGKSRLVNLPVAKTVGDDS